MNAAAVFPWDLLGPSPVGVEPLRAAALRLAPRPPPPDGGSGASPAAFPRHVGPQGGRGEKRKLRKALVEKDRRHRMNESFHELKQLMLRFCDGGAEAATKKQQQQAQACASQQQQQDRRLEKADVLEGAVAFIRSSILAVQDRGLEALTVQPQQPGAAALQQQLEAATKPPGAARTRVPTPASSPASPDLATAQVARGPHGCEQQQRRRHGRGGAVKVLKAELGVGVWRPW
uniref:Uncharacterized protein LOC116945461 n=1 Tax=Petromyzon marinus TaxID=7757 RepID=A0AAJ7WZE1_PETMA|nr:uncharacterized protein LOC116945461 [Petromyzon marinus]